METTPSFDIEQENKLILKEYRALLRLLRNNISKHDKKNIREAFELAMESHSSMRRKSGEPSKKLNIASIKRLRKLLTD